MKQRGWWQRICIGMMGRALTLAPLRRGVRGTGEARTTPVPAPKDRTPAAQCARRSRPSRTGRARSGLAIEKAMTSGISAAAKQAILNAYNTDAGNVQKALAVIKTAAFNVRAAFKNLPELRAADQDRHSERVEHSGAGLLLPEPGHEPEIGGRRHDHLQLVHVGCGGALIPSTTTSLPERPVAGEPSGPHRRGLWARFESWPRGAPSALPPARGLRVRSL